jgi:hypothetical protein
MKLDLPKGGNAIFASILAFGFIGLTGLTFFVEIPAANTKTADGAMVALGAALSAAVMALLRTDAVDAGRVSNTTKAFDIISEAQKSTPAPEKEPVE